MTSQSMRKNFALLGASVLASTLVAPVIQPKAAVATEKGQTIHSNNPFLNSIIPAAARIADNNDLYASVMMAQAILESAWGQSGLAQSPNHNLFGIKGHYNGESVSLNTMEDRGNREYYQIQANFRKYPSYTESLEDYAQLLRNGTNWDPAFYSGAWKSNAATYQEATQHLTGRYATDTAYASKLDRIIEQHGLTTYDTASSAYEGSEPVVETVAPTIPAPLGAYTVKTGDTLYGIAREHGVSLAQLIEWNQLNSSNIYPGMFLKVGVTMPVQPVASETIPAQPQPVPAMEGNYTVKPGDSLWKISQAYGVTVTQLKKWNGLKVDLISPGQVLQIAEKQAPAEIDKTETVSQEQEKTATSESASTVYTVAKGDTLSRIASKLGTTVADLKTANNLASDLIYPGQQLKGNKPAAPAEKPTVAQPMEQRNQSYTVKKGDSLYKIASQFGISLADLKAANKLTSDIIYPGQVLVNAQKAVAVAEKKAAAPVVVPIQQNKPASTYTVKTGDTLSGIAAQHGVTVTDLKAVNQLQTDLIYPGQVLASQKGRVEQPKPASAVQQPVEKTQVYTVKKGDTLYQIATNAGVSIAQLKEWNNLASDIIFVGQNLRVQNGAAVKAPAENTIRNDRYTVTNGDTLYSIARKHNISLAQLLEWNNVTSNLIYPGQNLRVN